MNEKERIPQLCCKYSNLTGEDIEKILKVANAVDLMVESYECDIFIDIPTYNNDEAIVVYHGKPCKKSMYKHSPVGEKAKRENEPGVWRTMSTGEYSKNIKARTQESRYVTQDIYPIRNENKIIGTLITERDINEGTGKKFTFDKNNGEFLSSTLMSIKNLNDYLDDAILIFDQKGYLQFKNVKADILYKSLGNMDEMEGKHYNELALTDITFDRLIYDEELNFHNELKIGPHYFLMKKVVVNKGNLMVALILHDITQLKDKDAELTLKTVTIREIHHRIKNNLQTISSLLRMQSRRSDNSVAKRMLSESVNRILSIAATHELLSKQLSDDINLIDVIKFVLSNLQRGYSDQDNIQLHFTANEEIVINSDKATVIALIINELVQNCYDHAFKGKKNGEITVSVVKENTKITISVIDDGVGFNYTDEIKKSLGITIVESNVKDKLKGTLHIQKMAVGTSTSFNFYL